MDKKNILFKVGFINNFKRLSPGLDYKKAIKHFLFSPLTKSFSEYLGKNIVEAKNLIKEIPKKGLRHGIGDLAKWTFKDVTPETLGIATVQTTSPLYSIPANLKRLLGTKFDEAVLVGKGMDRDLAKTIAKKYREEWIDATMRGEGALRGLSGFMHKIRGEDPKTVDRILSQVAKDEKFTRLMNPIEQLRQIKRLAKSESPSTKLRTALDVAEYFV